MLNAGRCAAVLAAAVLAAAACSPGAAWHPAAAAGRLQPPPGAGVRVVTVLGSGCPRGSAAIRQVPGNTGFRAVYRVFRAQAGPGAGINFRKNCQFSVLIRVPPGYTYAAVSADYRGYARLAAGARGLQRTSYYFQGMPKTVAVNHPLPGPATGPWRRAETITLAALGTAPCGQSRALAINTELRVSAGANPAATSFLTMDSAHRGATVYRFTWKRCPSASTSRKD